MVFLFMCIIVKDSLHTYNTFFRVLQYSDYGLGIIFVNSVIYLFSLGSIFGVFFCFDTRYFKTFLSLKGLDQFVSFSAIFISGVLSLAGMPPLVGFIGKFLIFLFVGKQGLWVLFILLLTINAFSVFFYSQTIRYMIIQTECVPLLKSDCFSSFDERLVIAALTCSFFVIFGGAVLGSLLIIANYGVSLLYVL